MKKLRTQVCVVYITYAVNIFLKRSMNFMAKRENKQKTTTSRDWVKFLAFWGLAISAILYIVTAILSRLGGDLGSIASILKIVATIFLFVAIAIPAYNYVRGKKTFWKILYWVCLVVAIVCNCLSF
jgi:glucan phosphoethanolaminetransferase (alkaline phosphatase superfamily)